MAIIIIRNQNFVTPFKSSENVPVNSQSEEMSPQQVLTPVKNKNATASRAPRRPQDYKVSQHCKMSIHYLNAGFMEKGDQTANITFTNGEGEPKNNWYVKTFCFLCSKTDLGFTFLIQQSMKNNSRSDV